MRVKAEGGAAPDIRIIRIKIKIEPLDVTKGVVNSPKETITVTKNAMSLPLTASGGVPSGGVCRGTLAWRVELKKK